MKGVCVCCQKARDVSGTPTKCRACLGCQTQMVDGVWLPRRFGPLHGRPDHELEAYIDDRGYVAWRLANPTHVDPNEPDPTGGPQQLTLDLGGGPK